MKFFWSAPPVWCWCETQAQGTTTRGHTQTSQNTIQGGHSLLSHFSRFQSWMFSYLDLQTHGISVVLNLYFVLILITIVLQNVDYFF